ncbi:hypothetical protein H257_14047 [Aphanomyces astaci]|uniref:Uncharacterized protein n=1 Tax=Aphanomyces astaci TaxID=112090 RepID=W4FS76_APHAT|nr:hypothetical protein H257_14047 [Aphanomyces astaci]ETV70360.1 hypothetical protein H257_14047 [Aphanomyces astaci]|eukprot:XP_009840072.1 hypothetical protein H257_14047 [Aphanomyces astaci]
MASAEPIGSVVELHQPLHVLEHKVPFRNLLMGLFVFYAVSFAITWYRVWWNSLAGILVAAVGLLWFTFPSAKDGIWLELYYYSSFGVILLHIATVGFLAYDWVMSDIQAALGISEDASRSLWGMYTALILVVSAQAIFSGVTVNTCHRLRMELQRNGLVASVHPGYTELT